MAQLILFNKPYDVLSQFTDGQGRETLADHLRIPGVYPAGRLDRDSEGLLLLTDSGALAHQLSAPHKKTWKTYWVQVERDPTDALLEALRGGVHLKDGPTLPAEVRRIDEPDVWPRTPPIRYRASIPTQWLEIRIREGRNRQVRRMTAAIGHPTLRLIRHAVGDWTVEGLPPGAWRRVEVDVSHLPRNAPSRHRRPRQPRQRGGQR